MTNKKRRSYRDVATDFIARVQVAGKETAQLEVSREVNGGKISKRTLWRAAAFAKEKGVKLLQELVDESFPRKARGKAPPHVGEERDYAMQVDTTGRLFLKVPGKHLGVGEDGTARVRFEPGPRIVITPRPKAQTRAAKRGRAA